MPICNCCGSSGRVELFQANGYNLGRCTDCDLHYVEPMPDPEARLADVHVGRYGDGLQVIDAEKQLAAEHARIKDFQNYVDLARKYSPGGRFLDVGCGAGFLMTVAQRAGYTPEGIELTADRLVVAARFGITVHDRPLEQLAIPDETFSAISVINVFSHLADPAATFTEVTRVLRPGGVVVVATGEIDGTVRQEHLPEWTLGDELFFLGKRTIDRLADRAGLRVVERQRTWLPDALFSPNNLRIKGRSRRRNAIKTALLVTPGALPALRYVIRRRQADNPIHSAVFVLQKQSR